MSAGTITKTGMLEHEVLASCLYSTYAYFACNNGDIVRYTLSGGAHARLTSFPFQVEAPLSIATDNTNLFWGGADGAIYKTVISGAVTTQIARLPGAVRSMCYASNVLYVTIDGGVIYTVTTA